MSSSVLALKVNVRKIVGKTSSRRLRRDDKIPAVIYSYGISESLYLDKKDAFFVLKFISKGSNLIKLQYKNEDFYAIVKHVQKHPYKKEVLHFDFQKVKNNDCVELDIMLRFIGKNESKGLIKGGVLAKQVVSLKVRCFVVNIPMFLDVDISDLDLNKSVYLSDIIIPSKVEILMLKSKNKQKYLIASIVSPSMSLIKKEKSSDNV